MGQLKEKKRRKKEKWDRGTQTGEMEPLISICLPENQFLQLAVRLTAQLSLLSASHPENASNRVAQFLEFFQIGEVANGLRAGSRPAGRCAPK
jgi:hypothetical protein